MSAVGWVALALWNAILVANVVLEIATRRRQRRLEQLRAELRTIDPDFVNAQVAAISRGFVARLRALVGRDPPSPTRDRALAVVEHFERAIGRDGRGLS